MGHRVTVVCQDRNAGKLPLVDSFIRGTPSKDTPKLLSGQIRIVVPDINDLLPVYIWNEYEGYTVKAIPDMSD